MAPQTKFAMSKRRWPSATHHASAGAPGDWATRRRTAKASLHGDRLSGLNACGPGLAGRLIGLQNTCAHAVRGCALATTLPFTEMLAWSLGDIGVGVGVRVRCDISCRLYGRHGRARPTARRIGVGREPTPKN